LVHALIYGTLRWQGRLDFIIDRLAKNPTKIDARVRTVLRLALFQMHHLDRIPASAAVNTAVELAKKNRLPWAAGFINGLLRRAATNEQIHWPDWRTSPDFALATRQAFPQWLIKRWIERWGLQEAQALCKAVNRIPSITLRTNTLKTDRKDLISAIQNEARHMKAALHAPEGIVLSSLSRPLSQWPAFQNGWFQVQDEAAQLVTHYLSPMPGETVWDACAGLGTKTAHIAQLMKNSGILIAGDASPTKLAQLDADMHRLGITNVSSRPMDLTDQPSFSDLPLFDRILVDAPCSGLGVLQKNPDGKWNTPPEAPHQNHLRQINLLEHTAPFLRPGGLMVYAVCSFEPEENESVVKAFLQKHPEFAIYLPRLKAVDQADSMLTPEGWLATFPHRHGMDGFYAAALIKGC